MFVAGYRLGQANLIKFLNTEQDKQFNTAENMQGSSHKLLSQPTLTTTSTKHQLRSTGGEFVKTKTQCEIT